VAGFQAAVRRDGSVGWTAMRSIPQGELGGDLDARFIETE
jgi:hypothetical protein